MSQKSKDCILCSVPYINMGDHIGSDDVVTICQGCRAELHAFVQDTQTKIASYPQSESDVQACIAEIESNMTFLATRNDFVYWQFQRAHLVGEIGQLLLDGKITPSGFRNLVKALPSESNHRSSRWSLEGTELVKNLTIRGDYLPIRHFWWRASFSLSQNCAARRPRFRLRQSVDTKPPTWILRLPRDFLGNPHISRFLACLHVDVIPLLSNAPGTLTWAALTRS